MSGQCSDGTDQTRGLADVLGNLLGRFLDSKVFYGDVDGVKALQIHAGGLGLRPGHQCLACGILGFQIRDGQIAVPLERQFLVGLQINLAVDVGCALGELSARKSLDPRIEGGKVQILHVGGGVDSHPRRIPWRRD